MKKTARMVFALLCLWGLILSAQAEGRVTIPQSTQIIEDYAFEDCESITELVIPDGVTRIGKGAFKNCENLQSVKIPGSVKTIDDEAFYGCARLAKIALDEGVKNHWRSCLCQLRFAGGDYRAQEHETDCGRGIFRM